MKQNKSLGRSHYWGLLAKWYDKLLEEEKGDIQFYRDLVLRCKGKVLELACGTGRLLVPYREEGAEIEGLDISKDMLAICREKLQEKNLTAELYEQDFIDFSSIGSWPFARPAGLRSLMTLKASYTPISPMNSVHHSLSSPAWPMRSRGTYSHRSSAPRRNSGPGSG